MKSVTSQIEASARSRGEKLRLIIDGIDVLTKNKIFVSISNTHFDFYTFQNTLSVRAFSWFTMRYFHIKNSTLSLEFGDTKICFTSQDAGKAYDEIFDILPKIFRKSELTSLGISPTQYSYAPTLNSAILRLKQRIKYSHDNEQLKYVDSIVNALLFSPIEIDFSVFKDQPIPTRLMADILPLLTQVKSISLEVSPFKLDSFKELMGISLDSGELEHIETNGPPTGSFDKFMKNLIINTSTKVRSLTFNNTKFNEAQLALILHYIKDKQLISLGLNDAIQSRSMSYFYFNFLADCNINCLKYLSLNNTAGINIYALLPTVSNITYLSLENCSLDVGKTLNKICKMKFNNLKALNLSTNRCKDPFLSGLKMPQNFEILAIDNVEWNDSCLVSFFNMIEENFEEKGFKLSIGKALTSRGEWSRIFNLLSTLKFNSFMSLVWDNNPVKASFFEFLLKQRNLTYLSVSGCFDEKEKEELNHFTSFIKSSPLRSLSVGGGEEKCLKKSISVVIDALIKREPLDYLSMRRSKAGDEGIEAMKSLLTSNAAPSVFIVDGAEPERSRAIIDFLDTAIDTQSNCSVSFPIKDLEYLVKLKRISSDEYNRIKEKFRSKEGESDSEFDAPFSIFVEPEMKHFPDYLPLEMFQTHTDLPKTPRTPRSPRFPQNSPRFPPRSPTALKLQNSSFSANKISNDEKNIELNFMEDTPLLDKIKDKEELINGIKPIERPPLSAKMILREEPHNHIPPFSARVVSKRDPFKEKMPLTARRRTKGDINFGRYKEGDLEQTYDNYRSFEMSPKHRKMRKAAYKPNTYDPPEKANEVSKQKRHRHRGEAGTIDPNEIVHNEQHTRTQEPETIIPTDMNFFMSSTIDSSDVLWDDTCGKSNTPAVPSQGEKSIDEWNKEVEGGDEKLDLSFGDSSENDKVIMIKPKSNYEGSPVKSARLQPSNSLGRLAHKKKHLPKSGKVCAGSDAPKKIKAEDPVFLKVNDSSNIIFDDSSDITDESLSFLATIDKIEVAPHRKMEQNAQEVQKESKQKVKSPELKINVNDSPMQMINSEEKVQRRTKGKKEKKHRKHKSKTAFDWKFPIERVFVESSFDNLEDMFSLEENFNELSLIQHNRQH